MTFSCYRRGRILDDDQAKQIVIHFLREQLQNQDGKCVGFVIMPDHVHAVVHFEKEGLLSVFMNQWKRRSSIQLKQLYRTKLSFWQIGRGADISDMLKDLLLLRNTGNELPVPPITGYVSDTRDVMPH